MLRSRLWCDVTSQVDVVIEMPGEVVVDALCCAPRVADELSLRHLVLDVRTRQIHREEDEREAHHVNRVCKIKSLG